MDLGIVERRDITVANWRNSPQNRWAFQNLREIVPTASISAGQPDISAPTLRGSLTGTTVAGAASQPSTLLAYLQNSNTESFVAMRDGVILDEWNAPHCDPARPHVVFSVSKSITGMLAGIAVGDGLLDPQKPVVHYVSEVRGSAYETALVRDLLDMTVSLDFEEDYLNKEGAFDRYRRAMLWNPARAAAPVETMREVLSTLPMADRPHGGVFFYASPNTDMLGLVIESAVGQRLNAYLRDRLWTPMGAKGAAYVTVDGVGAARAAGGICITARDLARFGQLVLDAGKAQSGAQVIPADWVADMRENGDPQAWIKGNFAASNPNGNYRSCWYISGDNRGCFAADGIHGQRLWVDPTSRVVLVKLSSNPAPSDDAATALDFSVLAQVARGM